MFPILHRRFGEDGIIQGLFEMAGIPYVGENVAALSISMDKEKAKIVWKFNTPSLYSCGGFNTPTLASGLLIFSYLLASTPPICKKAHTI